MFPAEKGEERLKCMSAGFIPWMYGSQNRDVTQHSNAGCGL